MTKAGRVVAASSASWLAKIRLLPGHCRTLSPTGASCLRSSRPKEVGSAGKRAQNGNPVVRWPLCHAVPNLTNMLGEPILDFPATGRTSYPELPALCRTHAWNSQVQLA